MTFTASNGRVICTELSFSPTDAAEFASLQQRAAYQTANPELRRALLGSAQSALAAAREALGLPPVAQLVALHLVESPL